MAITMATLLIADNDTRVRNNLKHIIEWSSLGFNSFKESSDGEDALAQILSLCPDLVILDTDLPKISGTDVLCHARKSGFSGACIIISAHHDFNYAIEAIRGHAFSYINKPIDENELYQAVCKICNNTSANKQCYSDITALAKKSKTVILYELMTDSESASLSQNDVKLLSLDADAYQVVICENFNSQPSTAQYSFAELLKAMDKDRNIFGSEHFIIDGREVVLLKGTDSINELSYLLNHMKKQPPQDGSSLDSMFFTYGRPVYSLEDIHLSYEDSYALLEYRFFCAPKQHALGYEMLREEPNSPPPSCFFTA